MKIFHLGLALAMIALHFALFADKASDDAAEKQRQENERQQRKIEDQQYEQRRQDQERINRQQEQRRQDQKRYDQRRLVAQRDREKRNDLIDRDDQDLMDETLEERNLERLTDHANGSEQQPGCAACPAPNMTCQDRETLNQIEKEEQCQEYQYEQRVEVVDQWDRDHSRD
jgi:hypothetical protein